MKFNVALGKLASGFTQNDVDGKTISLQDVKGQYVLLKFWASWCVSCRAESPNLIKVYNQDKGHNSNIIGMSLDKDKYAWLKAITKDGLIRTQLSDLKGAANEVAVKHGVQEIPENFLINPDGKIITADLRGGILK